MLSSRSRPLYIPGVRQPSLLHLAARLPARRQPARRLVLVALLGLLAFAIAACQGEFQPEAARSPDVILITIDTTRADHLGFHGYPRDTSPSLDAFARDAIVFERAWSTAPWTLPSHASMITGKYPTSHGAHYARDTGEATISEVLPFVPRHNFRANRLPESHETLAELLAAKGYATAAFVGGHWLAPAFGLLQGYAHQNAHVPKLAGRPASELTHAAAQWVRAQPTDRPIHVLINYFDPHDPYSPAATDRLPLDGLDPSLTPALRQMVDAYDAEIRYMDRHIGAFFDILRETERFDDALIIVVADHGELFGEHGRTNHGPWLYEELVRVALVVRLPGGRDAGQRNLATVSLVDLLPLVAQELGLELPEGVEGSIPGSHSMVVAESRSSGFHVRKLGSEVDRDLRALIEWPWKLVVSSRGEVRLYRLDEDPMEQHPRELDARSREMREALNRITERFRPPRSGVEPSEVPSETEANLRALGYIE